MIPSSIIRLLFLPEFLCFSSFSVLLPFSFRQSLFLVNSTLALYPRNYGIIYTLRRMKADENMKLGGIVIRDRDIVGAVSCFQFYGGFCSLVGREGGGNVVVGGGSLLMIDCFDWLRMIIRGWMDGSMDAWNAWMN